MFVVALVEFIREMTDDNVEFCSLAPTNMAALTINDETLRKFVSKMKRKSCIQSMKYKYISLLMSLQWYMNFSYQYLLTVKKDQARYSQ